MSERLVPVPRPRSRGTNDHRSVSSSPRLSPLALAESPLASPGRLTLILITIGILALLLAALGVAFSSPVVSGQSYPSALAEDMNTRDAMLPATIYAGSLVGTVSDAGSAADWSEALSTHFYEADSVWPALDGAPLSGASVWLDRSTPFSVVSGDRRLPVRGQGQTVGEGLASAGIYLFGRDIAEPDLSEPLTPNLTIRVDRISEEVEIVQETSPFETLWEADPELELDQTRMVREGQVGILLRRYKLTYVNGERQDGRLEDWWIQQEPLDRMMAYGTRVVVRDVETPSGPLQYWRRLRVLVTSYSPSTAGQPTSSPHYGMTRTGKKAGNGIIAVDASVIPFGTRIYVPGYGVGVAEDTGGAIIGKHIDVCYDDDDLQIWHRWVDVYLLAPAPPESIIRWVLPNWPKER
ncbi:MAG: 3D domain-containing protein [Anaerolineae bacterium]